MTEQINKSPDRTEGKYFSPVDLLVDFRKFLIQRTHERPGSILIAKGHEELALNIIVKAVNKLPYDNIITFANAIYYLIDINPQRVLRSTDSIESPTTYEFIKLRKKLIHFLSDMFPQDHIEKKKYLWLYSLLDVKEPDSVHLDVMSTENAVDYIKNRLRKIK